MGVVEDFYQNQKEQLQAATKVKDEKDEDEDTEEDEEEEEVEFDIEDALRVKLENSTTSDLEKKKETKKKERSFTFKWWVKPSITYSFQHPLVTSRLEKLMGSNCVSLTDREYMQTLQQRILIEYANSAEKRIKARELNEMERVKNLVLTGKVPFSKAPPEMADHPVMVIERYCQKLIAERRAKIKVPKVHIPNHLYWDDTIDPPSGLSIEKGHMFRGSHDRICIPVDRFLNIEDEQDVESGYMLTNTEFETLRYEDPQIKELKECQTVEELYTLADEVIGSLKTLENKPEDYRSEASSIVSS